MIRMRWPPTPRRGRQRLAMQRLAMQRLAMQLLAMQRLAMQRLAVQRLGGRAGRVRLIACDCVCGGTT